MFAIQRISCKEMLPMIRQPVSSSNVASVGYDAASGTLEVEFLSGGVYQYYNVPPDVHAALVSASSVGGFLARNVKNRYQYRQL
jgi:hypothetical protein